MCVRQAAAKIVSVTYTTAYYGIDAVKAFNQSVVNKVQNIFSFYRVLCPDFLTPEQAREVTRQDPDTLRNHEEAQICRLYNRFLGAVSWTEKSEAEEHFRTFYDAYVERSIQEDKEPKTLQELGLDDRSLQAFYASRDRLVRTWEPASRMEMFLFPVCRRVLTTACCQR